MKKTLIALALIAMSGVSFAQESNTGTTCVGTGACSPPANTNTVGDNRNGQIAAGGSIANGANVQAYGGVSRNTNTNTTGASTSTSSSGGNTLTGGASTSSATGGTSSATGGSVGNTSAAGGNVGNVSTGGNNLTATNGGNSLTGGAVSQTVNTVDAHSLEVARANADAIRYAADHQLRNTPSIANAALTSSNDTCMGSVSVGGSGPGFSIGVGSTYKDDNCVMLKNSREMWNMGFKAAAVALMCTDKANKEALELTGYVCPQTAKEQQRVSANAVAPSPQYTDPIVRQRMGLPPLK